MENQYGIAVKNRYDFFIDDDLDPFEILQKQEAASKSKDKASKDVKSDKSKTKSAKSKQNKNKAQLQSQNIPETKVSVDQNQNKKEGKFVSTVTQKYLLQIGSTWSEFDSSHMTLDFKTRQGRTCTTFSIILNGEMLM